MTPLVYVLPVHNEEHVLRGNVERLVAHLEALPSTFAPSVYLVENGSKDASWAICETLASEGAVRVRPFREANAGIGYAYHRGLEEAVAALGPNAEAWAVLTAADLPFGFTDLEQARLRFGHDARILMGSKAHAASHTPTGAKRATMSLAYRLARRAILGMRVGDSQGSVFVRLDLASVLLPRIEARGFFYSTELCYFAERAGERIVEMPVTLEESKRASTVRPLKHGTEMARQLWALRQRR